MKKRSIFPERVFLAFIFGTTNLKYFCLSPYHHKKYQAVIHLKETKEHETFDEKSNIVDANDGFSDECGNIRSSR